MDRASRSAPLGPTTPRYNAGMNGKDHVLLAIEGLNDSELEYVASIATSLRTRPADASLPSFDPAVYGRLYQELADEDRALAEQGIADYASGLKAEDGASL